MSVETIGAINRLTAAVLSLAVSVEKQNTDGDSSLARENIEYSYRKQLRYVRDRE